VPLIGPLIPVDHLLYALLDQVLHVGLEHLFPDVFLIRNPRIPLAFPVIDLKAYFEH
jgi:hypothetical protein